MFLLVHISARLWLSAHKTPVYNIRISQGDAFKVWWEL